MIKGMIGFVAIFVAFGICCVELKIRYDGYVRSVGEGHARGWLDSVDEETRRQAMEDGVLTIDEVYGTAMGGFIE